MSRNFSNLSDEDVMEQSILNSKTSGQMISNEAGITAGSAVQNVLAFPGNKYGYGVHSVLVQKLKVVQGNATTKVGFGFFINGRFGLMWIGIYHQNATWKIGYMYPVVSTGSITDLGLTTVGSTLKSGSTYADKIYLEMQIAPGRNTTNKYQIEPKFVLRVFVNGTLLDIVDVTSFSTVLTYIGLPLNPLIGFISQNTDATTTSISTYSYEVSGNRITEGTL